MLCKSSLLIFFSSIHFFFFKQKTAYEMRISDWSSDVCSSDLIALFRGPCHLLPRIRPCTVGEGHVDVSLGIRAAAVVRNLIAQIGRASCRERVCQYV